MKMGGTLRCLFWAVLYCVLYLVSASEEDLMDFDFTDLKEIDWNYENDNSQERFTKSTTKENTINFEDDNDLLEENQVRHPFDWREKVLRTALSKALSNKSVRQKFVEVMPILRVLSKQQRLALSALITAQINAKKGNELKLDQVRMMFGDDKSLILPIVYDIANLVRNSAKKYIEFDYNLADFGDFSKTKISYERRNLDLTSEELAEEENNKGIAPLPANAQVTNVASENDDGLEDFFPDMSDEVLDPQEINEELEIMKIDKMKNSNSTMNLDNLQLEEEAEAEDDEITDPMNINLELQKGVPTLTLLKLNKTNEQPIQILNNPRKKSAPTTTSSSSRSRRSAQNTEFVHKLIRSVPLSVNEEDFHRENAGRTLKLNTTAFASPKDTTIQPAALSSSTSIPLLTDAAAQDPSIEPYQIVEDLAFASLNGSEVSPTIEENIEPDAANDTVQEPQEEILPTPEELISGPRYRVSGNKYIHMRPKLVASKRNRVQVRARPKQTVVGNGVSAPKKCERFTASMCIRTEDYPMDQIMGSIRRHRNAMSALLAEYTDKPLNSVDTSEDFDDYLFAKRRREDTDIQGGLCQSIIRYARPQKARSASGEWKYIVNTGQHTQTLRLEKCMNPQESCSYLAANYRSHCAQVYNYHRLLSWDKTRGLHVDIFKVPTCCSCHIDGYKQQFPALAALNNKDFTPALRGDIYGQDHDFEEEEDVDEDEDFRYDLQRHHHQHDSSFDANELLSSSNRIRNKLASPTVGSYLSPPGSEEYERQYAYKSQRDTAAVSSSTNTNYLKDLARRRPHKSFSDKRSDQEYSPSEHHAEREVNVLGTTIGKDDRNYQKRKTISSVTHTASTNKSDSSTTSITASTGTIRAFTPTTLSSPTTIPHPRRPFTDTNAYQKPTATETATTEIADESVSTSLPSSSVSAATLPTHYYTRSRAVLKNKSRFRIPHTIASTNAGERSDGETSDTTDTTEHITTTSQQPDVYAVNPEIFKNHYKSKFNLTAYYSTTETSSSSASSSSSSPSNTPPKRVNYSYHPIIDFFEYTKRISATRSPTNTVTPKTRSTTQQLSSTHLYPHKIPKSVPANIYQQPQNYSPSKKQHQQNERRIGYGAAGDGSRVVFPNSNTYSSSSSSSGSSRTDTGHSNDNSQNSKYPLTPTSQPNLGYESAVTDVWHPVIVQDY